jgi:hypothetical protein
MLLPYIYDSPAHLQLFAAPSGAGLWGLRDLLLGNEQPEMSSQAYRSASLAPATGLVTDTSLDGAIRPVATRPETRRDPEEHRQGRACSQCRTAGLKGLFPLVIKVTGATKMRSDHAPRKSTMGSLLRRLLVGCVAFSLAAVTG